MLWAHRLCSWFIPDVLGHSYLLGISLTFLDHSLYSWSLRDVLGPFLMILDPSYVLYSSLKILVHPFMFLGLPCVLGPLLISRTIPYVLGPSFTFLGPLCSWLLPYALSLHLKKMSSWFLLYVLGPVLCFWTRLMFLIPLLYC